MNARVRFVVPAALASLFAFTALPAAGATQPAKLGLGNINHIVVIYQENHSFDNLYGSWERVNGLSHASAANTLQVNQGGTPYTCLKQNDVNLTSPPQPVTCTDTTTGTSFDSNFKNRPFNIEDYISSTDTTCPPPGVFAPNGVPKGSGLPGGCTRDLVHRFYQEQYQLNAGLQNRYVTGRYAIGLTMGLYKTHDLPIYTYLHQPGHPQYAISDKFFQAAFGGSFLNHQWLIAAATPSWPGAQHAVVDSNGMPNNYPLYHATGPVSDPAGTRACPTGTDPNPGLACGDYAVNTIQPTYQPTSSNPIKLPPQTATTIGDELIGSGVDWAWYAGGWDNADGRTSSPYYTNGIGPTCSDPNSISGAPYPNCPDKLFQFHHQPFNYFANYAPGTQARTDHLRDEKEFQHLASSSTATQCNLKPVSFVKPIGAENEHPGYTSESAGSSHLVDLIKAVEGSACKNDTLVISTYDEFGGQWDHVTPPGQGTSDGVADRWGPGTRIPALIISPFLQGDFVVDHVPHDTTSILATIEHRFGLTPLTTRDAAVHDLSSVFNAR